MPFSRVIFKWFPLSTHRLANYKNTIFDTVSAQSRDQLDPMLTHKRPQALDNSIHSRNDSGAAAAVVLKNRSAWTGTRGYSVPEIWTRIRPDMLFTIASMLPNYIAVMILKRPENNNILSKLRFGSGF